MELSVTPLHDPFDLPQDHSDETDSLAGFTFLAFGPSQHHGLGNVSIDAQPSSAGPLHVSAGSATAREEQSSEPWERKSTVREERGDDLHTFALSPSQIALPDSPEEPASPASRTRARITEIEHELQMARATLEVKDAELRRVTELVGKLKAG
jgi:hypothetical protein